MCLWLAICVLIPRACCPTTCTAETKIKVDKKTEFGTGVRTGATLLTFHTTCVALQVYYISDKFFDGLTVVKTANGTEFRKGGTLLRTFPQRLVVDVHAVVLKCPVRPDQIEMPGYGEGFMSKTSVQLSWKGVSGEPRPVSPLTTRERHPRPSLEWDYFLEVPSEDVPLTDTLLLDISFRQGTAHAHLSASLDWRVKTHR